MIFPRIECLIWGKTYVCLIEYQSNILRDLSKYQTTCCWRTNIAIIDNYDMMISLRYYLHTEGVAICRFEHVQKFLRLHLIPGKHNREK